MYAGGCQRRCGIKEPVWLHLDYLSADNQRWLRETELLPPQARDGLTNNVIRPRTLRIGEGALITLQTINNNDGDRPDQLVAFRIWICGSYIISTRHRKVHSIQTIQDDLQNGEGAKIPENGWRKRRSASPTKWQILLRTYTIP